MEEGLKCAALSAVVGEIWGNPKALDFTATRRLAVAAERGGVPALLLLFGAAPNLSGAQDALARVQPPLAPAPARRAGPRRARLDAGTVQGARGSSRPLGRRA
jgi:protein ImuA